MNILNNEIPKFVYTRISRSLHWLMAILVIGMLVLGWFMMSIEKDPGSGWYFMLHKSIGLIVLTLALLRLLWRLGNKPGPLPKQIPHWQVKAAKISHWLLYGALIAMPLAGLTGALYSKDGIAFFGYQLPKILASNHDLSELFFSVHSTIAWALAGLISLHVLAALKHLVIDKDGVFQRMWIPEK
jgi:cytochrome b561